MRFRSSLRVRLTVWYAATFLVAGAILVGAGFFLARHNVGPVRAVVYNRTDPPAQLVPQRRVDHEAWRRTLDQLAVVLGLLAAASVAAGWLLAGRILRPLDQITETAKRLSEANLGERIVLHGPDDELKRLADSLDGMLARLDAVVSSHRRFIADASHELRTPLAVMRAAVEVSLMDEAASEEERQAAAAVVLESVNRSDHLVQSLLALSRSEAAAEARVEVDLAVVATQALEELARTIEERALGVHTALESAVVRGDPALLRTLALNLLRNAVDYNRARGEISIAVDSSRGHAQLKVSNTGGVVLEEEVDELFAPFRRGRSASGTTGAGLGLAIVRSIVERHNGIVTARALEPGGLEVTVSLPLVTEAVGDRDTATGARRRSLAKAGRNLLGLLVLTCAFVVVAYAGIAGAAAAARVALAHASNEQMRRGETAFPFVWAGMSERTLRRFAGAPTWSGRSALCAAKIGGRNALVLCASGDRCLEYGDVDSKRSVEFCFRGGLIWKRRWRRDAWRALVDARPGSRV